MRRYFEITFGNDDNNIDMAKTNNNLINSIYVYIHHLLKDKCFTKAQYLL